MAKLTDFQRIENTFIYINRIASYINDVTETTLFKDSKTVDAIMYSILQLGKNISKLSDEFKKRHVEISGISCAMLAMFETDGYFMDEELWEVVNTEERGILSFYSKIETIYLKERQKPENKSISLIPAKYLKQEETVVLPQKKGVKKNFLFENPSITKNGFNPINYITTHSSIWTVKKK